MKNYFKYIQWGLFALVAIVALALSWKNGNRTEINNDESNWTAASISAYEMYFKGHIRPNVKLDSWFYTYAMENGMDTSAMSIEERQWYDFSMWTFGWKAPNMGKFLMGAYVEAAAKQEVDKNGYYEMGRPELKEDAKIYYSRVPNDLIYLARKPNVIMNALSVVVIFLTGWLFLNFWVGFISSVYLILNTTFFTVNTAAGLDSSSIFFWALAVFFLIGTISYIFKNEKLWKSLLAALITGIMFGFAVSAKLNAAMFAYVCIWVFLIAGIAVLWARKPENVTFTKTIFAKRLAALFLSATIIACTGVLLFFKLNPQADSRTKVKVIQLSVDEFFKRRANSQISKNREARKTLIDVTYKKPGKAFNLIARRNFMVDDTEKFYGTFGSLIKFKGNFLDGLFMLVGLVALFWVGLDKLLKEKKVNGEWIVLISFFVMLYGMSNFIWIDFARYHMAIYPGLALAIGYGLYTIGNFIYQKVNKKNLETVK